MRALAGEEATSQPEAAPPSTVTHAPSSAQTKPAAQSLTDAHRSLQLDPSHAYGAQSTVAPDVSVSVCAPSHVAPPRHRCVAASHRAPGAQCSSTSHVVRHCSSRQP